MTPRQFDYLLKRFRNRRDAATEHTEYMFAQLTSWVANTGFRSTEKPTQVKDFMPSQWGKTTKPSPPKTLRMTKKRRTAVVRTLSMVFPQSR